MVLDDARIGIELASFGGVLARREEACGTLALMTTQQATGTSGGRIADVIVSVTLMLVGIVGFAVLAFASLFLVMAADSCTSGTCNTALLSVAWMIAMGGPPLVFGAAIVWTIIRLARRKTSWWMPLAGATAGILVWVIAVSIMQTSVGR